MKIALAGNPNSGKTTLFNLLTSSTAHVGNYPGVTVEKREGTYKSGGEKITVVDLPGHIFAFALLSRRNGFEKRIAFRRARRDNKRGGLHQS